MIWIQKDSEIEMLQEGKRCVMFQMLAKQSYNSSIDILLQSTSLSRYVIREVTDSELEHQSLYKKRMVTKSAELFLKGRGEDVDIVVVVIDHLLISSNNDGYRYVLLSVDEDCQPIYIETMYFEHEKAKTFEVYIVTLILNLVWLSYAFQGS